MAQVTVTINDRKYQIACEDGQESHLLRLGNYVDKRAKELLSSVGHVKEDLLLVMTCLLISDELSDLYAELEGVREGPTPDTSQAEAELLRAKALEGLVLRIEAIADRIERS